jgi:glycosyltransferase involved in cell wall biosynthesis
MKDDAPLVSVIVATYNHEHYIRECLESIVTQETDFTFEVLVGEDCSTDGTREIVVELAKQYPNCIVPVLYDANVGSRQNGTNLTSMARGKYIAWCEGDDYWTTPDKLERQVGVMENDNGVVLVCSDVNIYHQDTGIEYPSVQRKSCTWLNEPTDPTYALVALDIWIYTCSACMRLDAYLRIRRENKEVFDSRYPMGDFQMWVEMSRIGKISKLQESMATYRVLNSSASQSQDSQKIIDFYSRFLELREYYVSKLGYGQDTLQSVRRSYFRKLIQLAFLRNSRSAFIEAEKFLMENQVTPEGLLDRCGAFLIANDPHHIIANRLYRAADRLDRTALKLSRTFKRLSAGK